MREYANMISHAAPLTLRAASSRSSRRCRSAAPKLDQVRAAVAACFDSEDYAEGRRAFAEKRKPRFQGK